MHKTNKDEEYLQQIRSIIFIFQNCRVAVHAQVPEELVRVANAKCIITTPIRIHGFVANVYIKRPTFLSAI